MRMLGGCAGQASDELHWFFAAGTQRRRCLGKGLLSRRLAVEQGSDALEALFGCRAQPAEVANALKAFGQDVLEEAMQELLGFQSHGAVMALVVTISEGDVTAVIGQDALGA